MRILDILNAPWAIIPDRLLEIRELYFAHTRREKIDLKAWEASTGRPQGSQPDPYQVVNGVAILDIQGVMTKADSAWNRFCGMTSTQGLRRDLQLALDDRGVRAILLRVDSPGGAVDGTQELADAVFAARDQKPIAAFVDGCMCSAAFWVGAAASKIFIGSDTSSVGSIGVYTTHVDQSKAEADAGLKVTVIKAGKFKAAGHPHGPLSEQDQALITDQIDHIYSIFVNEVAKFRGVSVETVLADMADARVFLGKQAIEAGLVDGVSTMDALIADLAAGQLGKTGAGASLPSKTPTATATSQEETMPIPREQLEAEAPELLKSILAEGNAQGLAQGKTEGAASELARVKGCLAAGIPGYDKLALEAALDGKTQPNDAAASIIAAQKVDLSAAQKLAETGGPKPLPGAADPEAIEAETAKKAAEATKDGGLKARWDSTPSVRSLYDGDFEAYVKANDAAATAAQNGRIHSKAR